MSKARTDYAYIAHRIDPSHPQNLGDYSIFRRLPDDMSRMYHFNSETGRLINRGDWAMPVISKGSRIHEECMKAIDRLRDAEAVSS